MIDYKYGSHLPVLAKILDITSGPILEVGMGLFSTPYLHMISELEDRLVWSFDNDKKWFEENKKWQSLNHWVYFVDDWSKQNFTSSWQWSVAIVDEKPAKNRKETLKKLANKVNFVVLHDTEPESDRFFKYSWVYKYYKYRWDYTKLKPNTTVLSNFVDLSFLT